MKRYAVQYQAKGQWVTAAIYPTRQEASAYAKQVIPEYATRIIAVMR